MLIVRHEEEVWDEWRPGVHSRAWATAASGAQQVRIAEQTFAPGTEAPMHWHYFEENITVLAGRGEFTVGGETEILEPGMTVIVLSTVPHGFRNVGDDTLHIVASMSWPVNEIIYVNGEPGEAWRAGESVNGGLRRKVGTLK